MRDNPEPMHEKIGGFLMQVRHGMRIWMRVTLQSTMSQPV